MMVLLRVIQKPDYDDDDSQLKKNLVYANMSMCCY